MDTSFVAFTDIFDLHCRNTGIAREAAILYSAGKVNKMLREARQSAVPNSVRGLHCVYVEANFCALVWQAGVFDNEKDHLRRDLC